jgi:alpha-galactosidase
MGWNSWNKFASRVDDPTVRSIADAMASNGMKEAGYLYINIDDTWEGGRDAQGNIQTNKKFPDMKALADYVHSKGLKLGIYSSPGTEHLRRVRRYLRSRRAGCAHVCCLGN